MSLETDVAVTLTREELLEKIEVEVDKCKEMYDKGEWAKAYGYLARSYAYVQLGPTDLDALGYRDEHMNYRFGGATTTAAISMDLRKRLNIGAD